MAGFNINKINNSTPLTPEEAYEITRFYVSYYWTTKFYSFKDQMELDDAVNEVYLKMLRQKHFEKYDSSITTKKNFICRPVFTTMVDMLRRQKVVYSLDTEDMVGNTKLESIECSEDYSGKAESTVAVREILEQLPNTTSSDIVGIGPNGETLNISYRTLAYLIQKGLTVKEMAKIYYNPKTGTPVSEGTISRHINDMKRYALDNVCLV